MVSIEDVQRGVPSIRCPSPAVSTAFEIPATPSPQADTAASHSTETVKGSSFRNRPWWSVSVPAHETEKGGQDKSDGVTDSLDMIALSLRNDTQGEEDGPTTSFGELQQPSQEESCLSSSRADFPSRQPGTWPSQDPFQTARSIELFEIPESSSSGAKSQPQPHLLDRVGSPGLRRDLHEMAPALPLLKHATHCCVIDQKETPSGIVEYWYEIRLWIRPDDVQNMPKFVRANRHWTLRERKQTSVETGFLDGAGAYFRKRARLGH